jgi:hypothetical protein
MHEWSFIMNGSDERLIFESQQVRRWADFSGDYNPIHFQDARALRAGLPGIVAHGMLVLIPVKSAASMFARSNVPGTDRQFKAYFKKPIPLGTPCVLRIDGTHDSLQFKVESETNPEDRSTEPYIRGSYGAAKDRTASLPGQTSATPLDWQTLSAVTLQARGEEYARVCDIQSIPLWAFLGSLAFSEYVRTSLDQDVAQWLDSPADRNDAHDSNFPASWVEREDITVLQTAFSLRHGPQMHIALADGIETISSARWRRTSIDAVDTRSETMGSISLALETASDKAFPKIEIEISLVAKKNAA